MNDSNNFAQGSALPFSTTDAILAQCLRVAGVPECPWSPKNVYSEEIVFRAGRGQKSAAGEVTRRSRYAGMPLLEAARKCHKDGNRGRVEYHFERVVQLAPLLEAYSDQQAIIQAEGKDQTPDDAICEVMRKAAAREMDEREALLRIMCLVLKTRTAFVNRWKEATPELFIPNEGDVKTGGPNTQTFPGGNLLPLYASDQLFRKMKLI